MNKNKSAFTLIELSIVLVIIGLIIGALLAGTELINQSRIRRLINDITQIQTATNTFRGKFGFYPGDFPFAGQIWTSATCTNAAGPTGCNGNGDNTIKNTSSNGSEGYRFWQHLNLADMINGSYTGTNVASDQFISSSFNNAYFGARYTTPYGSNNRNFLDIGRWRNQATYYIASYGFMTPINAYAIDLKMDDGLCWIIIWIRCR